jgi:hypothetical protein
MNGLINRQYVGARYVPKLMGEWNKTLQYEALSIVSHLGNSFTSKVPVPANIDITNTDYWVNTGNYNAQVEEYRKETENVANDLANYKNSFKTFALYFGNSYSRGVGSSNGKGLYDLTKDIYDGSKLYSGDGTGFVDYGEHANDTFLTHLEDAINDTSYDHKKVTHINILGAWGESREIAKDGAISGTFKIGNAIQAFMGLVKQHFPNCKEVNYAWCEIRFFYQQSLYDINNTARSEWLVNSIMSKECEQLGMRYLGWCGWNWNFSKYYVSDDNYHPSDSGYSKIAECLKNLLQHGSITYTSSINHASIADVNGNTVDIAYVVNPYSCILNILKLNLKSTETTRLSFDLSNLLDNEGTIISNIAFPLNDTVHNTIVSNDDGTALKLAPVRAIYENDKHSLVINTSFLGAIGNWHFNCCISDI